HVVVVTGADREKRGRHVSVNAATTVEIEGAPASDELKVKRARLALSRAQAQGDDAARAGAMKQLAGILGVGDAVMISKRADGRLQWETWRDRAPGFSAPREITVQTPDELIAPLAPPKPPEPPVEEKRPPIAKPIVIEKPWYRQRWVQASAGA